MWIEDRNVTGGADIERFSSIELELGLSGESPKVFNNLDFEGLRESDIICNIWVFGMFFQFAKMIQ